MVTATGSYKIKHKLALADMKVCVLRTNACFILILNSGVNPRTLGV